MTNKKLFVGEIGHDLCTTLYYALKEEDLWRIGCTETIPSEIDFPVSLKEGEIAMDLDFDELNIEILSKEEVDFLASLLPV